MIDLKKWLTADAAINYVGFEKTIDSISWLLIALVTLETLLVPIGPQETVFLLTCAIFLRLYRALEKRLGPLGQSKGLIDLMLLLFFAVAASWFTGKVASPLVSVIYVILMIASLTQGKRRTYGVAVISMLSYGILLYNAPPSLPTSPLVDRILEFLPFVLIAHLGTLLSGQAESARIEVERLSLTDDLTNLNNMRSFENLAGHQEKLAKRYQRPYAVCMLDTDNLKQINDRYGHLAGTELIKWTATIIRQNIRESDIAARFGGDEFVIMYSGHDKEQIFPAVERIVKAMAAASFSFEGERLFSTLSAGVASYPMDGGDLRSVIMKADAAMYLSKRRGKNCASLYEEGL